MRIARWGLEISKEGNGVIFGEGELGGHPTRPKPGLGGPALPRRLERLVTRSSGLELVVLVGVAVALLAPGCGEASGTLQVASPRVAGAARLPRSVVEPSIQVVRAAPLGSPSRARSALKRDVSDGAPRRTRAVSTATPSAARANGRTAQAPARFDGASAAEAPLTETPVASSRPLCVDSTSQRPGPTRISVESRPCAEPATSDLSRANVAAGLRAVGFALRALGAMGREPALSVVAFGSGLGAVQFMTVGVLVLAWTDEAPAPSTLRVGAGLGSFAVRGRF